MINLSGLHCTQITCLEGDANETFCGDVPPAEMTFYCQNLTVIFFADTSVERKGFKLRFTVNQHSAGL